MRWTIAACQGPVGQGRAHRAAWLARFGLDPVAVAADLAAQDEALLAAATAGEELVFWCEADPYDLADLAAAVALLEREAPESTLSGVVLDAHPELPAFRALVQLNPGQLAAAYHERRELSPALRLELVEMWQALCEGPHRLAQLGGRALALPGLARACRRLAEEGRGDDGYSRTERQLLEAIPDEGATARDLFLASQRQEAWPWLGDAMAFALLDDLAARDGAAIAIEPPGATASEGRSRVHWRGAPRSRTPMERI